MTEPPRILSTFASNASCASSPCSVSDTIRSNAMFQTLPTMFPLGSPYISLLVETMPSRSRAVSEPSTFNETPTLAVQREHLLSAPLPLCRYSDPASAYSGLGCAAHPPAGCSCAMSTGMRACAAVSSVLLLCVMFKTWPNTGVHRGRSLTSEYDLT